MQTGAGQHLRDLDFSQAGKERLQAPHVGTYEIGKLRQSRVKYFLETKTYVEATEKIVRRCAAAAICFAVGWKKQTRLSSGLLESGGYENGR